MKALQILAGLVLAAVLGFGAASAAGPNSIVDTTHNLSASGPGRIHALGEEQVCIFCHTPHGARSEAPLWNRKDSGASYIPYTSPTLKAHPGQPTGSSKLCLSCHDGTVGLGDLVSRTTPISMSGSPVMTSGDALIGTDLRDDHPISFPYAESLAGLGSDLAPPDSWDPAIRLDAGGMVQCTTCHNPHDNEWGKFLVTSNAGARLCRECHTVEGFDENPHALSTSTWKGSGKNPWPHTESGDVAGNACMNCHRSHHSPGEAGLLTGATDSDTCMNCHDGSVSERNMMVSLRKVSRHPILETSAEHEPGEDTKGTADHVSCTDCHNPHRSSDRKADAPYVPGMMEGVSGMTIAGTPIDEAVFEYEVCLKCHSEESGSSWRETERQISSNSIRREIGSDSPSFHPVVAPGRNPNVPSLISPLTTDSMIYCSDCHGDDDSGSKGTESLGGPHGSRFRSLLKREYQTGESVSESPTVYALCYGCHDRASILGNESFPGHRSHIVDQKTACSVCHDAHGIDSAEGNTTNNAHLINFDLSVVERLPASGTLEYRALGSGAGECSLRCHGVDHDARQY